jgi:hypothetical protein
MSLVAPEIWHKADPNDGLAAGDRRFIDARVPFKETVETEIESIPNFPAGRKTVGLFVWACAQSIAA